MSETSEKATVKLTNIVWDTDGEFIENLPNEFTATFNCVSASDTVDELIEYAINQASDVVGWCISSTDIESVNISFMAE